MEEPYGAHRRHADSPLGLIGPTWVPGSGPRIRRRTRIRPRPPLPTAAAHWS